MLAAIQRGDAGVVEAACNKLAGSELAQRIARTAVDLCGADGPRAAARRSSSCGASRSRRRSVAAPPR